MRDLISTFASPAGSIRYVSLPELAKDFGTLTRLPVSIRVMLESVVRNLGRSAIDAHDVESLARWQPNGVRTDDVPFLVSRVLLQDFTGVPLLVDLAAMRSALARLGRDVALVNPTVPVDLVIDHSIQVDLAGTPDALQVNLAMEFKRNRERYRFLKWGKDAFAGVRIIPPGVGICHQVNLEFLAPGICLRDGLASFDSLVGTDSHTTMINGLGIVGWGVGGIEAEAAMVGQPVYLQPPEVVGVDLTGRLEPGVTATDLVLHLTQILRSMDVVGQFVEFHGEGAASLTVQDRATVSNMAPEYGATIGYFPVDEQCCRYLLETGRHPERVDLFRRYHAAQGMFGMPRHGDLDYSRVVHFDLKSVGPSISGPKRPQDRIPLADSSRRFRDLLYRMDATGYGKSIESNTGHTQPPGRVASEARSGGGLQEPETVPDGKDTSTNPMTETEMINNRPTPDRVSHPEADSRAIEVVLRDGMVVIAAITSCTNTSNPTVMIAAGLLAKKAVGLGLSVPSWVKTSLAPGSRSVTEYLTRSGLQHFLDRLGFNLVGYGCTTCIGNSGPLRPEIEAAITRDHLIVASVLSGNRNFEARIHQSVKANFLMSPPLVVAFALAGRIDIDLTTEPICRVSGRDIHLRDLWPSTEELAEILPTANDCGIYRQIYQQLEPQPLWDAIPLTSGSTYHWDPQSTYIREPPHFTRAARQRGSCTLVGARCLAILGDSVTTDHISPAGAIRSTSPAGHYLRAQGVDERDFNSYGSRRGNHEVMVRGTFANTRLRNLMTPGIEGGVTLHQPDGLHMSIHEAAELYAAESVPLMIIAGQDYGSGSSRDWAAKGTSLLGVRVVVARSFERIHRSNLIGMGVLPCQFDQGESALTLGLDGSESFDLLGLGEVIIPRQHAELVIQRAGRPSVSVQVKIRIDSAIEAEYALVGGILPYMMNRLTGPPSR